MKADLFKRIRKSILSGAPSPDSMAMLDLTVREWGEIAEALNEYEFQRLPRSEYERAMGFANDYEPCVEGGFQC